MTGCLVLKGLVFDIPKHKIEEAFQVACQIIETKNIKYVVWDGDKYSYPLLNLPATSTFTLILPRLAEKFNNLKFIFFKKQGKAASLLKDMGSIQQDQFGNRLGPFPFLSLNNTVIMDSTTPIVFTDWNIAWGIEFDGDMKWYELGLKGLKWIKNTLHIDNVEYLIIGLGNAVSTEIQKVSESPLDYPSGISKEKATIIEVIRPTKRILD